MIETHDEQPTHPTSSVSRARARRRAIGARGAHLALVAWASAAVVGCGYVPPVMLPPGPPTQVTLSAGGADEHAVVRVNSPAGMEAACQMPCTVLVPSGTVYTSLEGVRPLRLRTNVLGPATELRFHRRSLGVAVTGGVLLALGGAFVAVSGALVEDSSTAGLGLDFAITGLVLLIPALILLLAAGSDGVSAHTSDGTRIARRRGEPFALRF